MRVSFQQIDGTGAMTNSWLKSCRLSFLYICDWVGSALWNWSLSTVYYDHGVCEWTQWTTSLVRPEIHRGDICCRSYSTVGGLSRSVSDSDATFFIDTRRIPIFRMFRLYILNQKWEWIFYDKTWDWYLRYRWNRLYNDSSDRKSAKKRKNLNLE